jgi:hypothetical protein
MANSAAYDIVCMVHGAWVYNSVYTNED